MRWQDMRGSDNVEDREDASPARGGLGGGLKLGGFGLVAVVAISMFLGLNPLPVFPKLPDQRTRHAVVQVGHESGRFLLDDFSGGRQLLVALRPIPLACLLEVVDRVEIHLGTIADGRIEVARHRKVEDEKRPRPANCLD